MATTLIDTARSRRPATMTAADRALTFLPGSPEPLWSASRRPAEVLPALLPTVEDVRSTTGERLPR